MKKPALYLITIGMLSATFALGTWTERRPAETLYRPISQMPARLGDWQMVGQAELSPSVQAKLKASAYISRTYTNGRTALDLFIAYYSFQRAGESMHSPKHCLPGAGWDISQHQTVEIPVSGERFLVNRYDIQNGPAHASTLYWYESRDRIVANEYAAKVLFAYDGLMKSRTAGSIVRITSPSDSAATNDANNFATLVIPEMQRCFGSSGAVR